MFNIFKFVNTSKLLQKQNVNKVCIYKFIKRQEEFHEENLRPRKNRNACKKRVRPIVLLRHVSTRLRYLRNYRSLSIFQLPASGQTRRLPRHSYICILESSRSRSIRFLETAVFLSTPLRADLPSIVRSYYFSIISRRRVLNNRCGAEDLRIGNIAECSRKINKLSLVRTNVSLAARPFFALHAYMDRLCGTSTLTSIR